MVSGVLDKLSSASGKAEIMGYDGIKRALEKKFGDVILKETYKVTNIWMEYFPLSRIHLIRSTSLRRGAVILR